MRRATNQGTIYDNCVVDLSDAKPCKPSLYAKSLLLDRYAEYSLVASQYRRIRYIGLRVSADTDTSTAITINSNLTPRRQNVTTNEAGISIHVLATLLVSDYPSRPAPPHTVCLPDAFDLTATTSLPLR